MPTNITDVTAFTSPVVAPADGDGETGASVSNGLQALANRTAYLNAILATSGVTLLRTGSAAALAALVMTAGMAGQIFYVSGRGIFEYKNVSALTVDGFWVYTAAGAASGQWVHELYGSMVNAAGYQNTSQGIATVGQFPGGGVVAGGRIQGSVIPYGQTGTTYYNTSVTMTTSSTSLVDLTGTPTINLSGLLIGDAVELFCAATYTCASVCSITALVNENSTGYYSATSSGFLIAAPGGSGVGGGANYVGLSFIRQVVSAGIYQIKFQGLTTNGASSLSVVANSIYARVFRP